jgi:hypothetical protein
MDAGGVGCEAWEKEIDPLGKLRAGERVAALYGL